jgi:hypothetical protein
MFEGIPMGGILNNSFYLMHDESFSSKVLVLLTIARLPRLRLYP